MPKYSILASDLDGTLLNSHKQISPENQAAIDRITEAGVYFVPFSGRTLSELPEEIRENKKVRYMIHSDGAVVYDKVTETRLEFCMSPEKYLRLLDILEQYDVDMSVRSGGQSYVDAERNTREFHLAHRMDPAYIAMIDRYDIAVHHFATFCRSLDHAEMISVFFLNRGDLSACRAQVEKEGGFMIVSSDSDNLEFFDVSAGKGNALVRLAEHLGIDPAQTVAVGDSLNDYNLLKKAGLSLAMANACDGLKAIADAVICHNDEHAIAYIEKKYLGAS